MNITLNKLQNPSNIVCLTDIPNILKIEDSSGGTYTSISLKVNNGLYSNTTKDNQWYIKIFDETISNVINPNMAVGKKFYVSSTANSTAVSIARALRCCPTIAANFDVYISGATIMVKAKEIGPSNTEYETNIISQYLEISATEGTAESSLYNAKVVVDVLSDRKYITTLEKNYYGSNVAFDISPVISTFANTGKVAPFELNINSLKDGSYISLGSISDNYVSVGYMVNQGDKYINIDNFNIAQNFKRGTNRGFENNSLLYVYSPSIPISFYNGNEGRFDVIVDYVDSAGNILETYTALTWTNTDSEKKLWDIDVNLAPNTGLRERFNQSFYIDIHLGSHIVRYNVIKPIKATEYYQRIYWRNSYNGISFYDFTGQKSETREVDIKTYQKNIFNYYDDEKNELEKIYDNNVTYTVNLKSHLFENDGKYIFNDLMQSPEVWVERNGEIYAIIIDSVSVEETNNNNIYEASIRYHFSQEPSII